MSTVVLTKQQFAVLEQLLKGLSNREVALALGISINNFNKLKTALYLATCTNNRMELFQYAVTQKLIEPAKQTPSRAIHLSPYQQRILQALWEHSSQDVVAEKLDISIATVRYHLAEMYKKTNTHSLHALIYVAIERNWITLTTPAIEYPEQLTVKR